MILADGTKTKMPEWQDTIVSLDKYLSVNTKVLVCETAS